MKYKFTFSCLLFLFTLLANSQIKFQRTIGTPISEYMGGAKPTTDGGYIISFSTDSYPVTPPVINLKAIVIKTDSLGNTLWTKTYTKPNYSTEGGGIIQTFDGGYLFKMGLYYNGLFMNACLVKTDSNGDTSWVKCGIGGRILQNKDSSYTLGGMVTTKLDTSANILWQKAYPAGGGPADFNITDDGGYILFGTTFNSVDDDFYLVKTDSVGSMQWNKRYGLTGGINGGESISWGSSAGRCVTQTQDGGYIMAGSTDAWGAGDYDIMVVKTNSTGNLQWTHTYGGTRYEIATSIREVAGAAGYVLTGATQGAAESTTQQNSLRTILLRLDANGNLNWGMMYGSVFTNPWNADDIGYNVDVVAGANGGFAFSGETSSMGANPGITPDIWLVKTDWNGVSGCNEKPALLNTNTPPLVITSVGNDSTIAFTQPSDSIVYIGTWQHIDSIICLTSGPVGVEEEQSINESEILISPNPTSGQFNVQMNKLANPPAAWAGMQIKTIEVINVLGEKVAPSNSPKGGGLNSLPSGGQGWALDLSSSPEGIYFVKIETAQGMVSKKVVVLR